MKKHIIAVFGTTVLLATSAQAADIVPVQQAPVYVAPVPAFSWTGFYIGAQAGYSWSDASSELSVGHLKRKFSTDSDGFMGGAYAGFNFDFGNRFILGLETDFAWADTDDKVKKEFNMATAESKIKEKWNGSTRLRVGYGGDRIMPYLAGGVAYTKLETGYKLYAPATSVVKHNDDDTLTGWTIGAGVDFAVTDHLLLRAEYRYTDYGDQDYKVGNLKYKADYKTNDVRIGVAVKF